MFGLQNQIDLINGFPSDGSSGSGWYDTAGALRAVESGGDIVYCTQQVSALADSYNGDGTPTGSLKFWLNPSGMTGVTSAPGMTAPYNPAVPDGYSVPPTNPPTAPPPYMGGGKSGGGATDPFMALALAMIGWLRLRGRQR